MLVALRKSRAGRCRRRSSATSPTRARPPPHAEPIWTRPRRFLDPIIVVRRKGRALHASTGRPTATTGSTALQEPDAKSILLCCSCPSAAVRLLSQILLLNIEEGPQPAAKNRSACGACTSTSPKPCPTPSKEEDFALEFEEPALATLGFAYEDKGRLSGGAYHAILRKVDKWLPGRLVDALDVRGARAKLLLDFDEAVQGVVDELKERGLTRACLRNFVVSRHQPAALRRKGEPPPIDEETPAVHGRARARHEPRQDRAGRRRLLHQAARPATSE